MALFARPDGDISVGSWSPYPADPTTLFDKIDEVTYDSDTTYIVSSIDEDVCEFSLTDVADPGVGTGHILRCWAYSPAGAGAGERFYMYLYENGNLRATSGVFNANRTGYTVCEYTLTEAEANSIGNYANLRVRIHITKTDADEPIRITQAEFEVPEAGAEVFVAGTISAVSGLIGIAKADRKAVGSISGISGLIGLAKVDRKVTGKISGVSSVTGRISGIFTVSGVISAISSIWGKLIKVGGEKGWHFLSHLLKHLKGREE